MNDINNVSWPGWEIVRKIGNGSFGAVYEIRRDVFGDTESAALKVITIPQSRSDIEELLNEGYDEASVTERFRSYLQDIAKEYSLMAKMKGHTNVVYCDDIRYEQHDDGIGWDIFIKMELLTPMMNTLSNDISEETAIRVGKDICSALILCKQHNIVHRDIKPQNIFVSANGEYKLGDFGIAKTAEKTTGGTKIGTYKYMAPEVYNNQPYGAAADIYSLGIVLYWLLNARRTPFLPLPPQTPSASIEEEARRRRFAGEQLPPPAYGSDALKAIVLKACAYNPAERYASPEEMLADLKAVSSGKKPSAPVVRPTPVVVPIGDDEHTVSTFSKPVAQEDATVGAFPNKPIAPDADATIGTWNTVPKAEKVEAPKPVKTEEPKPAKAEAPKPAKAEEPKPAKAEAPKPAKAETPKPAKASEPKAEGKKTSWALFAGIGAAVLAVILILVLVLSGGEEPADETDKDSTTKPTTTQSGSNETPTTEASVPVNTEIVGGEDLFKGQRFSEMLWGYYEAAGYDYSDSATVQSFLDGMTYVEVAYGDKTYEIAALPLSIQSGEYSHSIGSFYYDGEYYDAYTDTGKAMFRKAFMEEVGDLTEQQFQNIEETLRLDISEVYVVDRMGGTYIFKLAYKVENGKLCFYNFEIDDQYYVTLDSTPIVSYDILLDGSKLALMTNGVQRDYLAAGYKEDDNSLYFEGFALNDQNRYGALEGFSFYQYGHDTEPSAYVYLSNGDSPVDETVTFDHKTGEFTLSWTERWTTYNGNTIKEADVVSISGKVVPCTPYPSDGHGGMFLFIDGQRYDYLMSYAAYEEKQYSGVLDDDVVVDDLSTSELDAINAAKNSILEELVAALNAAGITAEVDMSSGRVTLEASFLFATNSAELSADGKSYLDRFVDAYASVLLSDKYSGYISSIVVEGHTDTAGSYSSNQVLSEQRAASVAAQCITRNVGMANVIQTKGCSYDYPIYNSDGSVNMSASRRVTFRFVFSVN